MIEVLRPSPTIGPEIFESLNHIGVNVSHDQTKPTETITEALEIDEELRAFCEELRDSLGVGLTPYDEIVYWTT